MVIRIKKACIPFISKFHTQIPPVAQESLKCQLIDNKIDNKLEVNGFCLHSGMQFPIAFNCKLSIQRNQFEYQKVDNVWLNKRGGFPCFKWVRLILQYSVHSYFICLSIFTTKLFLAIYEDEFYKISIPLSDNHKVPRWGSAPLWIAPSQRISHERYTRDVEKNKKAFCASILNHQQYHNTLCFL